MKEKETKKKKPKNETATTSPENTKGQDTMPTHLNTPSATF